MLGRPRPTAEQSAVIGAPLDPAVVMAGAGAGKTETMSARVVWLVANGVVRPEQVLGLTFTRKAARELSTRVRARLAALRGRGLLDAATEAGLLGEPTVLTYDAYAARIVAEHALRVGREPGARLVGEAGAWQLAQRVVDAYDGEMDEVDFAPATVVSKLMDLHGEMATHLVTPDQVRAHEARLRELAAALPRARGQRSNGDHYKDVADALARQAARIRLLPLVEEFRAAKRRAEVLDFADRAELAAKLAQAYPAVGEVERGRFTVVLLDEFQDTSHSQLVLLSSLFGAGHPVTAVGDPCQSIYGWRGASAGTLASFAHTFQRNGGHPAALHPLTASFRNATRVLEVANVVSAPLRSAGLRVPGLRPRAGAPDGSVLAQLHLTADDEARDVAARARALWDGQGVRRLAVLVRRRAQIPRVDAALRSVGLPVEVVGVGGLLTTPEVSDVVATLRVLADPGRGDALVRLLSGSRWRIGPRDLDALARWARRLTHDGAGPAPPTGDVGADDVDEFCLADALDRLPPPRWLSPAAERRLARLAAELRVLRGRLGQPLPDLVADVERATGLSVEVAVRAGTTGRANLDRFLDVAAEFASTEASGSLRAFLGYLDAAAAEERGLERGDVEVEGDRVQVLTVHGAKGLEWEAVFVVGMVQGTFPVGGERDRAWLTDPGRLPFDLRGDHAHLPALDLSDVTDQKALRGALDAVALGAGALQRLEERRLAYVAVTRAERFVSCSGYRWDDGLRPKEPGEFLLDVAEALGPDRSRVWVDDPGATNPLIEGRTTPSWPYDPLDPRRRRELEEGAAMVRAALAGDDLGLDASDSAGRDPRWARDVALLLAEREQRRARSDVEVELPTHLSVSQLVALRRDPAALARAIRRPVPLPPAPLARRGTSFHAWLEARHGVAGLLDLDELPGSGDEGAGNDGQLSALQAAFLASEWAERSPIEVEAPFELMLAGVPVRGRADAVFRTVDGGLEVVDWKTGPLPTTDDEEAVRAVQLAVYRLAFARLHGLPVEQVRAAFHHVREGLTVRPVDLLDEAGLAALLRSLPEPHTWR